MTPDLLARIVARAALAPSVHNVQPTRWRWTGDHLLITADLTTRLPASDPDGRDLGLSCGAATEATILALSAEGLSAEVEDLWLTDASRHSTDHRLAARVRLLGVGPPDAAVALLDRRFTHRGAFRPAADMTTLPDSVVVSDPSALARLARDHDAATARVLGNAGQRAELRHWMRLSHRHPRVAYDGMSAEALRMGRMTAMGAVLVLGPLWPVIAALNLSARVGSEAANTRSAAVVALFHRPEGESPVTTGRAYLRLWLAATALGWAGWPMASLTDDPLLNAEVAQRHAIPAGRRLVQALRFGPPDAPPPPRARRPLSELILS